MKSLFLIICLLVTCPKIVCAQKLLEDCGKYDYYVKKARDALQKPKPDYTTAIQAYRAARDCNPRKAGEADKHLDVVYKRIEAEKIRANKQADSLRDEKQRTTTYQTRVIYEAMALAAKDSAQYNPVKAFTRSSEAYQKYRSAVTMGVLMETYRMHRYTKDQPLGRTTLTVMATSPSQNRIAVAKADSNILYLYDSLAGEPRKLYGHEGVVRHIAFSPDGRLLASAADDRTIKIWTSNGQFVRTLRDEPSIIKGMAFSPDGRFIITGSRDGRIRYWPVQGGPPERKEHPALLSINFFAVSPKGPMLVVGSDQKLFYANATGELKLVYTFTTDAHVRSVGISPDGRSFIVSDSQRKVRIFNEGGDLKELFPVKSYVDVIYYVNDREIALATVDGPILLYQNEQNGELPSLIAHRGPVTAICRVGPDLWSAGVDKSLKRWNYTRQEEPYMFTAKSYTLSDEEHLHAQTESSFELFNNSVEVIISQPGGSHQRSTAVFQRHRLNHPSDIDKKNGLVAWCDSLAENRLVLSTVKPNSSKPNEVVTSWKLPVKGNYHVAFSDDGDYILVEVIPTLIFTSSVYDIGSNEYQDQVKLLLYRTPAMVSKMASGQSQGQDTKLVSKRGQ